MLERFARRTLIVILAVVLVSTLAYLSFQESNEPSWVAASSHPVSADYLQTHQQQRQQPFNITGEISTDYDPWQCVCYSYDYNERLLQPVESDPELPLDLSGESGPVIVPESFAEPSAELLDKINNNLLEDRVLITAVANYGMRDYLYNWIGSLTRTNEDKYLVFCLDEQLCNHLVNAGYESHAALIPEDWFHQRVTSGFEDYFSPKYRVITHAKTLVVQRLLYLDITVFFSDVDVVWLRPRMREYVKTLMDIRPETHVIFQQDGLDERQVNTGFYLMRPTYEMKRLLAETIYLQDTREDVTQQGAMNQVLGSLVADVRTSSVVLLDVMFFPNGFAYFDNNLSQSRNIEPYVLHANYRVSLPRNGPYLLKVLT